MLILALLLLAVPPVRQTPPAGVDAWVERAMTAFKVPGLALAVVKDGRIVMAKGYGVRKLGEPAAVDARTLFGIASNTKVFTATRHRLQLRLPGSTLHANRRDRPVRFWSA